MDNNFAEKENEKFWDEVAPIHYKSYNIDALRQGKSHIDKIQQAELYPVANKELLHLMCHIGTDSISLALDGAKVTAVDFSKESIELAKKLNQEIKTDVEFIHSNVFSLKNILKREFDIVYTSKGVLAWIKDINEWAAIVSSYLKAGGIFYIMEIHPMKYIFDDTIENDLKVKHSYFHSDEPTVWDDDFPDYADENYIPKNKTYEWMWSISDIINALIKAGLEITSFNEYDKLFYSGLAGMKRDKDGWYYLEQYKNMIPYTFTLKARKNG